MNFKGGKVREIYAVFVLFISVFTFSKEVYGSSVVRYLCSAARQASPYFADPSSPTIFKHLVGDPVVRSRLASTLMSGWGIGNEPSCSLIDEQNQDVGPFVKALKTLHQRSSSPFSPTDLKDDAELQNTLRFAMPDPFKQNSFLWVADNGGQYAIVRFGLYPTSPYDLIDLIQITRSFHPFLTETRGIMKGVIDVFAQDSQKEGTVRTCSRLVIRYNCAGLPFTTRRDVVVVHGGLMGKWRHDTPKNIASFAGWWGDFFSMAHRMSPQMVETFPPLMHSAFERIRINNLPPDVLQDWQKEQVLQARNSLPDIDPDFPQRS